MREEIIKQILLATVDCIEEVGIQKVTVRKIAEKAGVNQAAINYYFGSKENLIEETLKVTLDEGFINNLQDYDSLWDKDPLYALKSFLFDTIDGMMAYHGLTKAHFYDAYIQEKYDTELVKRFNEFIQRLYDLVNKQLPGKTNLENKFILIQILSAVFFPALFPKLFESFFGKDFSQKGTRKHYVTTLVDAIITNVNLVSVGEEK